MGSSEPTGRRSSPQSSNTLPQTVLARACPGTFTGFGGQAGDKFAEARAACLGGAGLPYRWAP